MPDSARVPASADAMVRKVTRLIKDDPGNRSVLRHSLGKLPENAALGVHRIVVPFLPDPPDDRSAVTRYEAAERAYYMVAALMAAQPRSAREQITTTDDARDEDTGSRRWRNLGYSLAQAVDKGGNAKSLENHLQMLTRQDASGLYRHLTRLILQLRGDQVRIDWGLLIHDLTRWPREPVAKEWAQSYYRTSERLAAKKANKFSASAKNTDQEKTRS